MARFHTAWCMVKAITSACWDVTISMHRWEKSGTRLTAQYAGITNDSFSRPIKGFFSPW